MNDDPNAVRWALEDEELEALIAGATSGDLGRVGNPVAEFFTDARQARGVVPPVPTVALHQLFALHTTVEPDLFETAPQPSIGGDLFSAVPVGSTSAGAVPLDQTSLLQDADALPFRRSLAEFSAADARRQSVYRRSLFRVMGAVLRPSGPKVLMGAAVAVLLVAGIQAAGLYDFPLLSGTGVETQAVGGTAQAGSSTTVNHAISSSTDGVGQLATLVPVPSVAEAATTTTTVPTTVATVKSDPATSAITVSDSSSTVAPETSLDTTASTADSSTSVTATTPVTSLPTTADPTTGSTVTASLAVGVAHSVPTNTRAGIYGAVVLDGAGCEVHILLAGGGETTVSESAGAYISFNLVAGDTVVTADGCPAAFAVS